MTSGTRDRLLAATWRIIQHEGVAAATSRRITEVAGANLAAITYHFGSKDALVGEAVVDRLRSWTAPLAAALTHDSDVADIADHDARVTAAVADILARFVARSSEIEPVITLLMTAPEIPGVREAIVTWLTGLRAVATDAMARQQAAGLVPETVHPSVMAAVFTAFALGVIAQEKLDPGAPGAAAVVGEFLGLLIRPPDSQ